MARGPKKHLKRLNAPHHWMLSKLGGTWAPRPQSGPHKARECLPLLLLLRNRLKYALNRTEVVDILMQRLVKVDGKVRTDSKYPAGFMDTVEMEKAGEYYRLIYDVRGRFHLVPITKAESGWKLCRVRRAQTGQKGVPYIGLHDGRTVRYPDPAVSVNDTVKLDLATNKVVDILPFEVGNVAMVSGGHNIGRVGVIVHREKHLGGFEIIRLKDAKGHEFATRVSNVFVIGKGTKPAVTLPKMAGIRPSILEARDHRLKHHN
eukprot:TRINITY_DN18814_c0_g2_i2.p2 TRINITY_DN18814_c0_g2~~TRINITY_DN18814_c0_g2_i2.p2  ORF type:complete len:274 (-),score=41.98 TRINITY_DN18814_c0_g2_i2:123-905(-)